MVVGENTMSPQEDTYTEQELVGFADRETRQMLGLPWHEATQALERGELAGTAAEAEIRMLSFLLGK
jgi:hypothetical protein